MLKKFLFDALFSAPKSFLAQFQPPSDTGLPSTTVSDIISNLMSWILSVVGILAIIAFAIAGILYMTSGGDEERISSAKRAFIYSILGVIIALSGLVIVQAVQNFLNASKNF
jgi:hypothetical protein